MSHCQIFYPFDNADGYISVICHRERFLNDLLSVGWQKTAAEAVAVRDQLARIPLVSYGPSENPDDYEVAGPANEDGTIPVKKIDGMAKDKPDLMDLADKAVMDVLAESVPLPHDAADQAPAAKKRDKLSLKK